jgi:hypothetical protein
MLQALLKKKDVLSRITRHRLRSGFVNGIDWLIRDPKSVVGQTPWAKVISVGKLVVRL